MDLRDAVQHLFQGGQFGQNVSVNVEEDRIF